MGVAMGWVVMAVMFALGGCVVDRERGDGCGRDALVDQRTPGPAYTGFRWACTRGPTCPDQFACDAAVWRQLDDGALAELTACLLGPCERRGECVEEALIACTVDRVAGEGAGADDARDGLRRAQ